MHQIVLDNLDYNDVVVISPTSENSYAEIGGAGIKFRIKAWQAVVATDILGKLLRETRPYEVNPGETDRIYKRSLSMLTRAIEKGKKLGKLMKQIREDFKQIKINRQHRKPVIGVVGEIFMRSNRFSNNNVIRRIENLGGEAWLAPISEWIYYTTQRYKEDSVAFRKYGDFLKAIIQEKVQRHYEHQIEKPFKNLLLNYEEPPTVEVLGYSAPYMHFSFGGEAILTIGKAIDYVKKGASGIVNVMPFGCMPGMVTAAVSKRLREDLRGLPWINADYDGQEETGTQIRLEAFMYQARQYKNLQKSHRKEVG